MAQKKIPIAEANVHQLRKHGEVNLGLSFPANATMQTMLALIATVDQSSEIPVDDFVAMEVNRLEISSKKRYADYFNRNWKGRMVATGDAYNMDPPVILIIPKEEKPGGDEPVPIGVNGKAMYIPRAQLVEIPYRFFLALKNAVRTIWVQVADDGQRVSSETPAYPFQVHHLPSPDEIEEWDEKVNKIQRVDAEAA